MNPVVDTSVWSLVLRRPRVNEHDPHVHAFRWHLESGDGLRSTKQFDRLLTFMAPYPLLDLDRQTYVAAARLQSVCRSKGINAGPIDFLIAAACSQHGFPLLTADKDFVRIASHCDLVTLPT